MTLLPGFPARVRYQGCAYNRACRVRPGLAHARYTRQGLANNRPRSIWLSREGRVLLKVEATS